MNDSQELDEVLFETAAGMDTPESRESFLELIRRADPARGEKLRGLLEVNDRATSFFRRAEGARTVIASEAGEELIRLAGSPEEAAEDIEEEPNERIGRYRLIERIGEGGCGVVYLAQQREPVRRQVALKVIRLGMDTERVVARFEMERQSLALMDHPNIARVLGTSVFRDGMGPRLADHRLLRREETRCPPADRSFHGSLQRHPARPPERGDPPRHQAVEHPRFRRERKAHAEGDRLRRGEGGDRGSGDGSITDRVRSIRRHPGLHEPRAGGPQGT